MSHVSYKVLNATAYDIHTVVWCIDEMLMLIHSPVREIRAVPVKSPVPVPTPFGRSYITLPSNVPSPQLKLQFNGHEKDIIELSYCSPTTLNYVKGDVYLQSNDNTKGQKKLIKTIYHNLLETDTWTYLTTFFKRDIIQEPNNFLCNGIFHITVTLKVTNIVTPETSDKSNNNINKFLNMRPSADAVIVLKSKDGQEYNVHKAILASQSAVMKAHFEHGTTEIQTNVIESQFDSAVLEEILSFMYSNKVQQMNKMAKDILAAADYYQLDGLKVLCEEELGKQLTADNAKEMFELASLFQAIMLKRWSSELIKKLQCCQKINEGWKMEFYI